MFLFTHNEDHHYSIIQTTITMMIKRYRVQASLPMKKTNIHVHSLRTADVSPHSSPLRDVSLGGTSATQRQKFHTDDAKSIQNLLLFRNDRQKTKGSKGQV